MTFLVLALLAILTVALLVYPVVNRAGSGAGAGIEVYRDQLDELERDHKSGLIDAEAAGAARREIERRLLREDAHRSRAATTASGSGRWFVPAICVAVIALAVGVYADLGTPGLPDQPLLARMDAPVQEGNDEFQPLITRAEARVNNEPFDLEGWVLLANTYAFADRYGDAANAMSEAVALDPNNASTLSALGEFVTLSRGGTVTPAARVAFSRALTIDPTEPVARYYEGVARAQDGDFSGALNVWQNLLAESAPDAPWVEQLRLLIADAEAMGGDMGTLAGDDSLPSGPTQEDIDAAAEMTPDEQMVMIRGMVEGLALRLEDEPDNLEGWARLAQSYGILSEWRLARDAYDHALTLAPGDAGLLSGLSNAVAGAMQGEATVPDWGISDMERVLMVLPGNPEALYFTGLAAAQIGDRGRARERWTALRDLFPEGSNEWTQADTLVNGLQ
jgi:cytochrome c-type biogenesis protein CcmH